MTEKEALILLNTVAGIGSIKLKRLLDYFGSARKVFSSSRDKLRRIEGISGRISENIIKASSGEALREEMSLMKKYNVDVLTLEEEAYPENLKTIADPPPVIYVKGEILPRDNVAVAIVGSIRPSIGRPIFELGVFYNRQRTLQSVPF